MSEQLLMTRAESAKSLRLCERTLWRMTKQGEIPCVRVGRAVRYDPVDLTAWIARRKSA